MDRFTREELTDLIEAADSPAASIYLPTHPTGREMRQDPIRLKKLLGQAESMLTELGLRSPEARDMLQPAAELLNDDTFWWHQSLGLALLADRSSLRHYRVPIEFPEMCLVSRRFHVVPLLSLLEADGPFYVLAVSRNQVRLLQASRFDVRELHPDALPKNLADALNIDEYKHALQLHSHMSPSPAGGRASSEAIFHGQGGSGKEVEKRDELLEYFHRLDDALESYFHDESTPLVFAGVEYLFPIFRQVCHYRGLVDEPLPGNPELSRAETLRDEAWKLLEPRLMQQRREALQSLEPKLLHGLGCRKLDDIIPAAQQGAVDALLLAQGKHAWGTLEPGGEFQRQEKPAAGSEDLLNYAAVETLRRRGRVFVVEPDELGEDQVAAALLRYPRASTDANVSPEGG